MLQCFEPIPQQFYKFTMSFLFEQCHGLKCIKRKYSWVKTCGVEFSERTGPCLMPEWIWSPSQLWQPPSNQDGMRQILLINYNFCC